MLRRVLGGLAMATAGSVAPTVALSLTGLIAAGGLAFDYARMAGMDSELQNAADQAALAAASQLDGEAGARARATSAAQTLIDNDTLFSNDGGTSAITVPTITYWQDKARTAAATSDANANFVLVEVGSRQANFSLTAIVSAIAPATLTARAFAGLDAAICKVPPLMMCNPTPGTPFDPDNYRGVGLKLFQGGGSSWGPGNFGYLDVGATNNGSPDQRIAMGMDAPGITCVSESNADVDTGVAASVLDAINVRFDIFQNGWSRNTCFPSGGCSSAFNTTKDVVRRAAASQSSCGIANNNNEWKVLPDADQYIAQNSAGDDATVVHMGYPMDTCHYPLGGGCPGGRLGNGAWRRDIYFKTNHSNHGSNATGSNWQAVTGLGASATRHDFYEWEISSGNRPDISRVTSLGGGAFKQWGSPVCKPPGLPAGVNQPDRRVIAVAVADNCASLTGSSTQANIGAWAEAFLTQPVVARPGAGVSGTDLYVEIIREALPSGNGTTGQLVRRDVPYLIE